METDTAQKMDVKMIVARIVPVTWLVMEEAIKVGGLHLIPSMREGGAARNYIGHSQKTYKDNPIVEGVIECINHGKGGPRENCRS